MSSCPATGYHHSYRHAGGARYVFFAKCLFNQPWLRGNRREYKNFEGRVKKKEKIIVIIGQTATGKSALAVELAKKLNSEIISADSRQVYKIMDICTDKIK